LSTFFTTKICINLDRRPDRWKKMVRAFKRNRIEGVVRFSAVDGREIERPAGSVLSPGEIGCLRSHLAVVKRYYDSPRLLIFEDDCLFVPRFRRRFAAYAAQLPAEWHLLLFGDHNADRPDRVHVSRNVFRAKSIWRTHAYALDKKVYDAFIALCEQGRAPVDGCTIIMQDIFDCYCFTPRLAWQDQADSDIPR
jgi:GR25 family glycosyltransferase involved in LPS biosynthesis